MPFHRFQRTTVAAILATTSLTVCAADEREAILNKLQSLMSSSSAAKGANVTMAYIPAGSEVQKTGEMVIGALSGASRSKVPVAIVGPDGALLLKIVTLATENCPQGILSGVTVIYLGRDGDNEKLDHMRTKCGADFVFGTYP